MKNKVTSAIKSRTTKLSKKSTEDLINIILRKDDIEHKMKLKYDNLMNEIDKLLEDNQKTKEENNFLKNKALYQIENITYLRKHCKTIKICGIVICIIAIIEAIILIVL